MVITWDELLTDELDAFFERVAHKETLGTIDSIENEISRVCYFDCILFFF